MIKGLYSAYTGMEAAWKYQEMLANNIANASTAGYKRELAAQQAFSDVLLSQQAPVPAPLSARIQSVVGQIGTGTFVAEFTTDMAQGTFQATGAELDLALENGFFAVETQDAEVFYTRDGRFGRDANGDLVTSQGYYVLNADGGHINLPSQEVAVGLDGSINRNGELIDQLMILDFTPAQLTRSGEAFFAASEPGAFVNGNVRQGYIEASNTVMVEELTSLLSVYRAYQANQTLLARLDGTLDQAAGQLGQYGA